MQSTAHLVINGQTVKVLVRPTPVGVALKLRLTGKDGTLLQAESEHLSEPENANTLLKLLAGKTIRI
jgi:hypothetical protein